LPDDQNREFRLSALGSFIVDNRQDLAEGPHLRPGEFMAEGIQYFGISHGCACTCRRNQDRANALGFGKKTGTHPVG
jgi:hypothetical protein